MYRGVAGVGSKRRVRGYSWSLDENVARRFAEIRAGMGLSNPAVYRATIDRQYVLANIGNDYRQESELLLLPFHLAKIKRLDAAPTSPKD